MSEKSKQYINESMGTVQNTIKSLQQALDSMDDESSRATLKSAIDYLDSACQELYEFTE